MMTVKEALQRASSRLKAEGIREAALTAEWLLRHVLGWDRTALFSRWDETLGEEDRRRLQTLLQRRMRGEPVQYIVGEVEFYGLPFYVNPAVLIPRPETEILLETAVRSIERLWGREASLHAADIGTGSGVLAVTLAKHVPNVRVSAVDLSKEALAVAKRNAKRHNAGSRIAFLHGNLLEPLLEQKQKVDILLSNPPYISTREMEALDPLVRLHEPPLALHGGEDGLRYYREMIGGLPQLLDSPPCFAAFEVGQGQAESVAEMLERTECFDRVDITPDLAGIPRVVSACRRI